MKKIFIGRLLICCGLALLCCSCKEKCKIEKPKNLKPIDWENYNDVYTVFWNCKRDCSDESIMNDMGRNIKVFGWIFHGQTLDNPREFALISNEEDIFWYNFCTRGVGIYVKTSYHNKDLLDSLKAKFATSDMTKKCYVSGMLSFDEWGGNECCNTEPEIWLCSIDDIYFE